MTSRVSLRAGLLFSGFVIAVSSAGGQSYGPESQRLTIGAPEFQQWFDFEPHFGQDGYLSLSAPGESPASPTAYSLTAHVSLPEGALMEQICLWANDTDLQDDVTAVLIAHRLAPFDQSSDRKFLGGASSEGALGYRQYCQDIGEIYSGKVDFEGGGFLENAAYSIEAILWLTSDPEFLSLGGVQIIWRRAVVPPPSTPTFDDVPTSHPFFSFIEALAASGITGGCGDGKYCPEAPLKRGQMAVFLAKALGLHWVE